MPITFFKNWFFSQLPQKFKDEDTYKDGNDEGLLERYLRNFGDELDENVKPFIDNFLDLFDAMKCHATLLPHLSFIFGSPITIDDTEQTYRRVIAYAMQIYKIKGTDPSYQMLMNFIGIEVSVIEDEPQGQVLYDSGYIYDNNPNSVLYDTGCAPCSGYSLAINNVATPLNPTLDPTIMALIQNIICFIQPINAKFDGFIKRVNITDTLAINITENTSLDSLEFIPGSFDDSFDTPNSFN